MCRMLGVAARERVSPLYFEDFHRLAREGRIAPDMSERHEDGWGVAGHLAAWAVHFGRSAHSALRETAAFEAASDKALRSGSSIVLAHIRKASAGGRAMGDVHPFIRRGWIFCHNGTVDDAGRLCLGGAEYEGTTDSELLFQFLIAGVDHVPARDHARHLRERIAEVRSRCSFNSLTFLLSNGRTLFAYREYTADEEYYTLWRSHQGRNLLVCSEPLPGREWMPLANRELLEAKPAENSVRINDNRAEVPPAEVAHRSTGQYYAF